MSKSNEMVNPENLNSVKDLLPIDMNINANIKGYSVHTTITKKNF